MAILCSKCKTSADSNDRYGISYQKIRLFEEEFILCNNCCDEIVALITGRKFIDGLLETRYMQEFREGEVQQKLDTEMDK